MFNKKIVVSANEHHRNSCPVITSIEPINGINDGAPGTFNTFGPTPGEKSVPAPVSFGKLIKLRNGIYSPKGTKCCLS